jgi:hypothetical protein
VGYTATACRCHRRDHAPYVAVIRCFGGPRTGAACQRQHWASHKRQCRALAREEYISAFGHRTDQEVNRILHTPDPSELPLIPKLSAITWTMGPLHGLVHITTLISRANLLGTTRPAPGDTQEGLVRLLKRATTELPWPELPGGTQQLIFAHLTALSCIATFGDPEAAVKILSRHVEDIERKVVAPNHRSGHRSTTSIAWSGCWRRRGRSRMRMRARGTPMWRRPRG